MRTRGFAPIIDRVRTALAESSLADIDLDDYGTFRKPEGDGPVTRLTIWRASFLSAPHLITCCADCYVADPWHPHCDHEVVWA